MSGFSILQRLVEDKYSFDQLKELANTELEIDTNNESLLQLFDLIGMDVLMKLLEKMQIGPMEFSKKYHVTRKEVEMLLEAPFESHPPLSQAKINILKFGITISARLILNEHGIGWRKLFPETENLK